MSAERIMPLSYFKAGGEYTGQMGGMRYLIKGQDDKLMVFVWKGPFRFDTVEESDLQTESFGFDEEGREEAIQCLNRLYEERKDYWDKAVFPDKYYEILSKD